MKKTTTEAKIIYETNTSFVLALIPFFFLSIILFLLFKTKINIDLFVYILFFVGSVGYWYMMSFQKKLVLTSHKVYIIKGKVKLASLSLLKDLEKISYSQSKMGTRFGFGSITIAPKNGVSVEYKFIANPKITYEQIVYAMETKYIALNPDFERTVNLESQIDVIDNDSNSGIDKI